MSGAHVLKNGGCGAFTLMEMLTVMAIVCLLVTLALGITSHAQRAAREARARAELELIRNALQERMLKNGGYPPAADWTNAVRGWLPGGFTFKDPWNNLYIYTNDTATSYSLYSRGQRINDPNDDIVSGR